MFNYADFKSYLVENDGQAEGYLHDIDQQWQAVHAEAYRQIEQEQPVVHLLACIHFAFVMTSINSQRTESDNDYEEQYYAISGLLNANTPQADTIHDYLLNQLVPTLSPFNQILVYSDYAQETKNSAKKTSFLKAIESNLSLIKDPYQKSYAFYQLISADINPAQNTEYFTRLHEAIETVADPWQQAGLYRSIAQLDKYPEKQANALQLAIEKL